MKHLETNAGYKIIKSQKLDDNTEVAIGFNKDSGFYVCWMKFERGYDWGVYSENKQDVLDSFNERTQRYLLPL